MKPLPIRRSDPFFKFGFELSTLKKRERKKLLEERATGLDNEILLFF